MSVWRILSVVVVAGGGWRRAACIVDGESGSSGGARKQAARVESRTHLVVADGVVKLLARLLLGVDRTVGLLVARVPRHHGLLLLLLLLHYRRRRGDDGLLLHYRRRRGDDGLLLHYRRRRGDDGLPKLVQPLLALLIKVAVLVKRALVAHDVARPYGHQHHRQQRRPAHHAAEPHRTMGGVGA